MAERIADQAAETLAAQRLQEAFAGFRRMHRRSGPIEGLTPGELMVLTSIQKEISSNGVGMKVSDISSMLNVASPTITQQINNLESHGLVERAADKEDRRVVRISLTEKGEVLVQKASEAFLARLKGLMEFLGEEDTIRLADLLIRVQTYFEQTRDPEFQM